MPANGRRDLIRRLKVNTTYTFTNTTCVYPLWDVGWMAQVCVRLMRIGEGTLLVHQQQIMKEVCVCVPLSLSLEFRVINI